MVFQNYYGPVGSPTTKPYKDQRVVAAVAVAVAVVIHIIIEVVRFPFGKVQGDGVDVD